MPDIPLFDSLTHPTLDGTWIGGVPRQNTLQVLESEMVANKVEASGLIGLRLTPTTSARHLKKSFRLPIMISTIRTRRVISVASWMTFLAAVTWA